VPKGLYNIILVLFIKRGSVFYHKKRGGSKQSSVQYFTRLKSTVYISSINPIDLSVAAFQIPLFNRYMPSISQ